MPDPAKPTTSNPQTLPPELAERLDVALRAAEAAQQELDQTRRLSTLGMLLALVAHEFNNLLTPVLSYAQLAKSHPEDAELARKALDRAAAGAEQASRIATAVLALARPEKASGFPCCGIRRVVEETLRCLGRDLSRDGITLVCEIEEGAQAAMSAAALQQVLLNLVLNARRAMQRSGGELRIAAKRKARQRDSETARQGEKVRSGGGAGRVVIEVADTGPGMSAAVVSRLFTAFETTAGDEGGTGLGLVVCKRLVEAAGGTIRVESAVGEGTRFEIEVGEGAAN